LRVLFWGTPEFALPSLRALLGEGHEVVAVVTQPDRPSGRGQRMRASPVKEAALEEGVPVLTPEKPRGPAFLDALGILAPEISVVVAYGHILTPEVLDSPTRGSVNLHASLLPELRGAAPIAWAIMRGHRTTGVTVMRMTPGMDEGPILLQREVPIEEEDSAGSLASRLSEVGAEALVEALAMIEFGGIEAVEQDSARATYAPKLERESARVDWGRDAREVANHIRGNDPAPGAWTTFRSEPVKLFTPRVTLEDPASGSGAALAGGGTPGTVLAAGATLTVRAGRGAIDIGLVQPAGRRRMEAGEWVRGDGPRVGETFE
jgi:methionyl-tRNA formyltransferase